MGCQDRSVRTWTRRQMMAAAAGFAAGRPALAGPPPTAAVAPASPVAVAPCRSYGAELLPAMERMFDQIGGLGSLVNNKTVAVKINMTGGATTRLYHASAESTYWTHPNVVGVLAHLLAKAGARRIRIIESFATGTDPLEEHMLVAGWEPNDLLNAAPNVEAENTGFLGYGRSYHRLRVLGGGYIYPAFDLNHSYEECDVFVSVAKLKEHFTAGVTLTMKNLFGIAPTTIYGNGAGVDEPSIVPRGGRQMFHDGDRQPSKSAPGENAPNTSNEGGYRVPRIVVDLLAARPIDLAVIDGIETMTGGEGPWIKRRPGIDMRAIKPGILIAGRNPVCTDAVGTAAMGFDPMAERGTAPFETCDSTLALAEAKGIGSRDLGQIEVTGTPVKDVMVPFRVIS